MGEMKTIGEKKIEGSRIFPQKRKPVFQSDRLADRHPLTGVVPATTATRRL